MHVTTANQLLRRLDELSLRFCGDDGGGAKGPKPTAPIPDASPFQQTSCERAVMSSSTTAEVTPAFLHPQNVPPKTQRDPPHPAPSAFQYF